jgi:putative SOS response-associated peptidase YedK
VAFARRADAGVAQLIETDASTLTSYPVSTVVNSAQNDDPRCIEEVRS